MEDRKETGPEISGSAPGQSGTQLIRQAISAREFMFDLMPCIDLETEQVVSEEALLRWRKDGKILAPGSFLGELEKNGDICLVDRYLWEEVCRMQREITDCGKEPTPVSVNLSSADFCLEDLEEQFVSLCRKYEIPSSLIEIEIPERACVENREPVLAFTRRAHEDGFTVHIDNFGNAAFTDQDLRGLRADVLKLDRNYMEGIHRDGIERKTISEAISLGKLAGIRTVAKSVETKEQEDELRSLGCRYAQGFRYYRMMLS